MAELLVDVLTGKILHVAKNGHQWGLRESREAYDAHVRHRGTPKHRTVEVATAVPKRLASMVRGEAPIPTSLYFSGTEKRVPTPPPDRMGIIRVPGEADTLEGVRLNLAAKDRDAILSRTVDMSMNRLRRMIDGD